MIKAESKGGERTLRSASPHRNAYKSDFHAIKCSFDGSKSEAAAKSYANGSSDTREDSRGRPFGTRVNKIKNIFLQMDGQQQECQDAKVTLKSDVSQVSPTKLQLPVSPHRVNFNTATSPESHNLDKTPKGEDVEIDKVALAEKFSVTRKLFERGIKEQPAAEKQSPNRVVSRLSLGSSSDEGKSTRRASGSSETTFRSEQTSTVKCQPEENADGEKKHASRVSLNAGPMSKRLENYMGENDSEDNNTAAAKRGTVPAKQHSITEQLLSTSPTRDSLHKPTSPVKEATNSSPAADATNRKSSPTACAINKPPASGSNIGLKPTFPVTNAAYKSVSQTSDATNKPLSLEQTTPISHGYKRASSSSDGFNRTSVGGDEGKPHSLPPKDVKQPPPSASGFQNTNRVNYSEKSKTNDSVAHCPAREKPPSQTSSLDKGMGMVRAELVVVQNESSESEENEDDNVEDNVFEEQKVQSPKELSADLQKPIPPEKQNCSSTHQVIERDVAKDTQKLAETMGEGRVQEDNNQLDNLVVSQDGDVNCEEDDEAAEEESELEEQVGQSTLDRASPVVYGIENAAFVDDRDVDQVLREEEEEEEEEDEDQIYREYDDCYEAPGLSDEEEPPAKRRIKFSSDPILVCILCSLEAPKNIIITNRCVIDSAVVSDRGVSLQTQGKLVEAENECF